MSQERIRQTAQKIINKIKWWEMLSRFIDVLRINIYIIDSSGTLLLPPEENRYGGKLLTDKSLQFYTYKNPIEFIKDLHPQGQYLEAVGRYELHSFAIPIAIKREIIAYMIVGPVILNKKLESARYDELAQKYGANTKDVSSEVNDLRVLSNVMINSILDLLAEIVKDNVELSVREDLVAQEVKAQEQLSQEVNDAVKDITATVRLDELLITLLDVALKMTNTEHGSIMVIDDEQGDLVIKVARGLDSKRISDTKVKIGEGIAGLAAKENTAFIIDGKTVKAEKYANRIIHMLKRPEIKHSLIMPLTAKQRVFGVLNLHTNKEDSKIDDNFDNLQYLSKLLSSAF